MKLTGGIAAVFCALAAAALHTAAVFYASVFAAKVIDGVIVLPSLAGHAVTAGAAAVLAEYIFFGRKDEGRRLIYRFVQHNVLSFICAYAGYAVYCLGGFREQYDSNAVVFKVVVPGCIHQYYLVSGAAVVVCVIIWLIRRTMISKKNYTTDNKAEEK